MNQKGKIEITTHEDTQTADFLSGDKVICVDTNWQKSWVPSRGYNPLLGEIHCVRGRAWDGGLLLVGIHCPVFTKGEVGYWAWHFRRLHR